MEKLALRRSLLQTRRLLTPEIWTANSLQICQHLEHSPIFQRAQTVLAYSSFRQEPDLSSLLALDKTWGLPRCMGQSLVWHCWSKEHPQSLQTGAYGILEPHADAPVLQPEQVDLILVPCVACDDRGYRLGYGGGFYDRLLSAPAWQDKRTIGITFEFAHLPQLPTDEWDQPLKGFCTEKGLVWVE